MGTVTPTNNNVYLNTGAGTTVEGTTTDATENTQGTQSTTTIVPQMRENMTVTETDAIADGGGSVKEVDIPAIDPAEEYEDVIDLEALLAYLTLETDEQLSEVMIDRIKSQLDKLTTQQQESVEKMKESLDLLKEQQEAAERDKILGWISTGLAVLGAALSIVFTAGSTAPLAIAACVCCVCGAALSLTQSILNETGVVEDYCEELAQEKMEKNPELSHAEAYAEAQNEWNMGWMIASTVLALGSLACGIGSMVKSGVDLANTASKLKLVAQIAQWGVTAGSLGLGITQTVFAFENLELAEESAEAQAELLEIKKLIELINSAVEEDQAALEQLLMQMQDIFATLQAFCETNQQGLDEILQYFNQSAS